MVLKTHIVLGCLNNNGCAPVRPLHHVGYDLKSWIPSVLCLKYFDVFIALRKQDYLSRMWLSELLRVLPGALQLSSLISQCACSCIPCSRHPRLLILPSHTSIHASASDVLLLASSLTELLLKLQGPDWRSLSLWSFSWLIWAVNHSLLHHGSHSHLYGTTCLPHYPVVICRSVTDRISICLSISSKRSVVIITWLSLKVPVGREGGRLYLLKSLSHRAVD